MTERLSQLMAGEADVLDVPPPATAAVLRQGRGIRRRRALVASAAGAVATVVVAGSVFALSGGGDGKDAAPDPASGTVGDNAVFSYGNVVYYDGPGKSAQINDKAVKSLFYTSAGVLVRHGDNAYSDGGGPQRFSLVTTDGTVNRLGLVTEETVHASDTDQPYVAYAENVDGELEVVVYDVTSDSEAARVSVGPTKESWFPLSLDGDTVLVGDGGSLYAVDWRTGEVTGVEAAIQSPLDVDGGRGPGGDREHPTIVDVATGETLLELPSGGYPALSPDGRYAYLTDSEDSTGEFVVYGVDDGTEQTFRGEPWDWGWTADGDLFRVGKDKVTTCHAATGECTDEAYEQPNLPDPPAVTETYAEPVCPAGTPMKECFSGEFYENCNENPDQCEWEESTYVDDPQVELKLGGRIYES